MADEANDVTKALAAFGAPAIRYHSFGQGQVRPSSIVMPRRVAPRPRVVPPAPVDLRQAERAPEMFADPPVAPSPPPEPPPEPAPAVADLPPPMAAPPPPGILAAPVLQPPPHPAPQQPPPPEISAAPHPGAAPPQPALFPPAPPRQAAPPRSGAAPVQTLTELFAFLAGTTRGSDPQTSK